MKASNRTEAEARVLPAVRMAAGWFNPCRNLDFTRRVPPHQQHVLRSKEAIFSCGFDSGISAMTGKKLSIRQISILTALDRDTVTPVRRFGGWEL